ARTRQSVLRSPGGGPGRRRRTRDQPPSAPRAPARARGRRERRQGDRGAPCAVREARSARLGPLPAAQGALVGLPARRRKGRSGGPARRAHAARASWSAARRFGRWPFRLGRPTPALPLDVCGVALAHPVEAFGRVTVQTGAYPLL